jgi:hypothetical protein
MKQNAEDDEDERLDIEEYYEEIDEEEKVS